MNIIKFNHVAVDTMDTERSRAFYEALGGKTIISIPREDGGKNYHVEFAPGAVVEIQPPKSGKLGEPAGWGHVAFQTDDIQEACRIAAANGGNVAHPPMDKMMGEIPITNAIVFGPDGEKIEFLQLR